MGRFKAMKPVVCILVFLSFVISHDNPASSVFFEKLHGLSHVRHQIPSKESNNILVFHSQLAPLARIANAIYLEQCLLKDPSATDSILAELLNINDVTVMKKLEELQISQVNFAITNLENQPEVPIADVETINEGLKALGELETSDSPVDKIPDDQVVTDYQTNVDNCKSYVEDNDFATNLEVFKKKQNDLASLLARKEAVTAENLEDIRESFSNANQFVTKVSGAVDNLKDVTPVQCKSSKTEEGPMNPVVSRAKISKWYETRQAAMNKMSNGLSDLEFGMTILENSIKGQGDFSGASQQVIQMKSVITTLQSQDGTVTRKYTSAFPEGAADLERVGGDLNEKWIHRQLGSTDPLKAALKPLKPLSLETRQAQSALYSISVRRDSFSVIGTVETTLTSLEAAKKNLKDLPKSVDDVNNVLTQSTSVVPFDHSFLELYLEADKLTSQVVELQAKVDAVLKIKELKELQDNSAHVQQILEKANGVDHSETDKVLNELKADTKVSAYLKSFKDSHKDVKAILDLSVKVEAGNLNLLPADLVNTVKWAKDSFPSLVTFLGNLKQKSSSFQVLRKAIAFMAELKSLKQNKEAFSMIQTIADDFTVSIEHLKRARQIAQKLAGKKRSRLEVEQVSKFTGGAKAAKSLGDGSQLIGEMGQALARKTDLETVATNSEVIGQEIQNVKNQKVKSDIEKGWKESDKIKRSLEALVSDVTKLGKEIPATGASDMTAVGTYLAKLKNVKDPGISVKDLQASVGLLNSISSNPKVTETSVALSKLADLNLNFASHSSSLSDVSTAIQSLDNLFKDVNAKHVAPTSTVTPTDITDQSTPVWRIAIVIFLAVALILFLVFDVLLLLHKGFLKVFQKLFKVKQPSDEGSPSAQPKKQKKKKSGEKTRTSTSKSKSTEITKSSMSKIGKAPTSQQAAPSPNPDAKSQMI